GGAEPPDCAILRVVVRHVTPAVRPDDVLTGLLRVANLTPPHPPRVTRLAQGPLDEATGTVHDPLTPDRSG
ncbi:MAG: TIGR03936 family radical SAM-associated protein, partial [Sporichthyaceae bacterium]